MSIIVVEGPDNSGKSVLAAHLAKDLGACYIKLHQRPVNDHWIAKYQRWLDQCQSQWRCVVLDRHPVISELVYGPILRGQSNVSITQMVRLINATVILCTHCSNKFTENQLEGVVQNMDRIRESYGLVVTMSSSMIGRLIRYDYEWDDYNQLRQQFKN